MSIHIKRAYEDPAREDGYRVLVDRLWPRGIAKQDLKIDVWLKDLAPSTGLRKWFAHDVTKWDAFKRRYFEELDDHSEAVAGLLEKIRTDGVTLVYAAKDEQFNNASALKEYLERQL